MVRWECRVCGKRYKTNPEKCGNCDNTVFTPYEKPSLRSRLFGGGSKSGGKQTVVHSSATTKQPSRSSSGTTKTGKSTEADVGSEDGPSGVAEERDGEQQLDPHWDMIDEDQSPLPVWVWVILFGMGLWGVGYLVAELLLI